jgi:hypothetical protein
MRRYLHVGKRHALRRVHEGPPCRGDATDKGEGPMNGRKPRSRTIRVSITCERCHHVTELELARSKLRNVTARCAGCGASVSFRWSGVKAGAPATTD